MLSLGVDVSRSRGLDVVLLDEHRRLVEPPLRRRSPDDLACILAERQPDIVAIDSPPKLGTSGGSRPAERDLMRLGIHSYFTPSDPTKAANPFYDWMRAGFAAFQAAERAGYPLFTGKGKLQGSAIEVFPHGSAVALKGYLPISGTCKSSGRKKCWRASVLETHGVDTCQLRSADQVDAALAAITGLFALESRFWIVGNQADGVIVLPGEPRRQRFRRERREGRRCADRAEA